MLNARQLGLKMIANVTYGYTSARYNSYSQVNHSSSFSGRMPCVEIADSIVQTARETLERVSRVLLLFINFCRPFDSSRVHQNGEPK